MKFKWQNIFFNKTNVVNEQIMMRRKTRKSVHFIHFKSFAFLSDCMVANLTAIRCVIQNFICTIWHKHQAQSTFYVESHIALSLNMYLYPFVRCASNSQWDNGISCFCVCVFFFPLFRMKFPSNVSYSAYTSYFIHMIHSIRRFIRLISYIWEGTKKS